MTLASDLDEYLTEKRILVISGPSLSDPLNRPQAAELLSKWKGLVERDFFVQSAEAFSVVLIEKDGKTKQLRPATALPLKELFAVVDAMPIRETAMRKTP